LEIFQKVYPPVHPQTSPNFENLGSAYEGQEKLDRAWEFYEHALSIDIADFPSNHPNVAKQLNHLGRVLRTKGNKSEARKYYKQALVILKNNIDDNHPHICAMKQNIISLK